MVNLKKHKKVIIISSIAILVVASASYVLFFRKSAFDDLSDEEVAQRATHALVPNKVSKKDKRDSIKVTLDNEDATIIDYLVAAQNALDLKDKAKVLEITKKARKNVKELDKSGEETLRNIESQAEEL